jgi:hypothetical protein
VATPESRWATVTKGIAFSSHFLHDMYYRWRSLAGRRDYERRLGTKAEERDLTLTAALLKELDREVTGRGGRLLVVFIPSKAEVDELANVRPYQHALVDTCKNYGIDCFDLAPAFHDTWRRTYYRLGMHWNARGHRVATEALLDYLRSDN